MRISSFILLIFFLTACTTLPEHEIYHPEKLQKIQNIQLDITPDKAIYSSSTNTVFIKKKNDIYLYNSGNKINIIGGLGFNSNQFNNLSDITIAPDGNLYTLDSFDKKIKKFDKEGRFITEFELNDFSEPALFDVSINENFYIYDNDRNEITVFNSFDQGESYSFGKFQITKPTKLIISKNHVLLYSAELDETVIFDRLGQYIEKISGNLQMIYGQKYFLEKYWIRFQKNERKLGVSHQKWNDFILKDNFVIKISDKEVQISKIKFEN